MRLSVKKVAHNCSRPVLRRRKSGGQQAFSWFSPKENHTSRSFSVHSNCETALARAIEPIGHKRHFKTDERASARFRGNSNHPLQSAHPLAHTNQSKAMSLKT